MRGAKFERSLIVSEEGRAIRLYLNLNPSPFEEFEKDITEKEILAVGEIFGYDLDEDEFFEKIFHCRLESLLMSLEKKGQIERKENKDGITEYLMTPSLAEDIKRRMRA